MRRATPMIIRQSLLRARNGARLAFAGRDFENRLTQTLSTKSVFATSGGEHISEVQAKDAVANFKILHEAPGFALLKKRTATFENHLYLLGTIHGHPRSNELVQHALDLIKPDTTAIELDKERGRQKVIEYYLELERAEEQGKEAPQITCEFSNAVLHKHAGKIIQIDAADTLKEIHLRLERGSPFDLLLASITSMVCGAEFFSRFGFFAPCHRSSWRNQVIRGFRDEYMARKLAPLLRVESKTGTKAVAIVGRAHLPGIVTRLLRKQPAEKLSMNHDMLPQRRAITEVLLPSLPERMKRPVDECGATTKFLQKAIDELGRQLRRSDDNLLYSFAQSPANESFARHLAAALLDPERQGQPEGAVRSALLDTFGERASIGRSFPYVWTDIVRVAGNELSHTKVVQDELFDRHQALSKLAASAHSANVEVVNYKLAWPWAKDKLTGCSTKRWLL